MLPVFLRQPYPTNCLLSSSTTVQCPFSPIFSFFPPTVLPVFCLFSITCGMFVCLYKILLTLDFMMHLFLFVVLVGMHLYSTESLSFKDSSVSARSCSSQQFCLMAFLPFSPSFSKNPIS